MVPHDPADKAGLSIPTRRNRCCSRLRRSHVRCVMLDELSVFIIVDNETDTLSSIADGVPQTPEIVHHLARVPASRTHYGNPCKVVFDRLCCAGHGFSALVTGRRGPEQRTMLFDVGPYADLWLGNATRL